MPGYAMDKDDVARRLRRIEGQVRGLQRMVDDETYCIAVLTQISAVGSALDSVALGLLDQHIRHCVADAARDGDEAEVQRIVAEATSAIARLVRS